MTHISKPLIVVVGVGVFFSSIFNYMFSTKTTGSENAMGKVNSFMYMVKIKKTMKVDDEDYKSAKPLSLHLIFPKTNFISFITFCC